MDTAMLQARALWSSAPPDPRTKVANNPTLLFSWWCTGFSLAIILVRLVGRKTRSGRLFTEDWIMMFAILPLCARMGFIHIVLIWGTNNLNLDAEGFELTPQREWERSMGARMVLAARIFYALFIWASKFTVSEFLKRITIRIWRPSYEKTLHCIRIFLVATFIAVLLATLLECRPFRDYWQVTPDPGPQCRQNFVQLITMGTADIITDILLVAFPIPIVMRSGQSLRRKIGLSILFSLSIALIGITATRVPQVISHHGRQQYRTVWASCEILASTAVSNALIIGAFLRDKGTKKNKYKANSVTDSMDRSSMRRPTASTLQGLDSDEDLFRTLGLRIPEHLQTKDDHVARPAGPAPPAMSMTMSSPFAARNGSISDMRKVLAEGPSPGEGIAPDSHERTASDDLIYNRSPRLGADAPPSPGIKKQVSFFDVGGLLEDTNAIPGATRSRSTTLVNSSNPSTIAHDFAPLTPEHSRSRRGSRVVGLEVGGGRLTPTTSRSSFETGTGYTRQARRPSQGTLPSIPQHPYPPRGIAMVSPLMDAGGLLAEEHVPDASAAALGRGPPATTGQAGSGASWEDEGIGFSDAGGLLRR